MTGDDCTDLLDSLKGVQLPVRSPSASGNATAFIDSISQDTEGHITATKKNVDFNGYQPVAGMGIYQANDAQKTGEIIANASVVVTHRMGHYPTVRLIDSTGRELRPTSSMIEPFQVRHTSVNELSISNLTSIPCIYVLD